MNKFYLSDLVSYKPETQTEVPKLEFADPLFKRRLSQITKMTIQVVHDINAIKQISDETKLVFISMRGEIKRQLTINQLLIEENTIMPAAFSLSVFNTPIASATLVMKLHGGYSVIYPSKNNFQEAFKQAVAPVLAGTEKEIILVYADEYIPDEYGDLRPEQNFPLAFACRISTEKTSNSVEFEDFSNISSLPADFLKYLTM